MCDKECCRGEVTPHIRCSRCGSSKNVVPFTECEQCGDIWLCTSCAGVHRAENAEANGAP